MIRVENLWFSYDGKKDILKDINVNFKEGEIVSIIGPNGCGKTTFLKCILGLLKPKYGNIYIYEKNIFSLKRNDIAKYISYVPQEHKTSFPYRVIDVVLLGRAPYIGTFSTPKKADIEKCREILNLVDIGHLSERLYTQISGGERKLCLIARALSQDGNILVFDEPTSYLDIRHEKEILSIIKNLVKKQNLSVIMTLHNPNLALLLSSRVILLKDGEVYADGLADDVITKENIKNVYHCDVSFISDNGMKFVYLKVE